ncbi:MAG TPA: glycosyltransferase family 4 protein [Methylomirabilota bacterium]|nr:glycosyltransferase family 4 protein [Methylomirabilota bacterium]
MKISILCFDLADNAAGRAHLLAHLLEPIARVEVVGPCYGDRVWEPVAGDGVAQRTVSGRRLPAFALSLRALLEMADGDLLYASKPRLTSAGIGYLKRLIARRPLLLDIDDWEVGFFLRSGFWGTAGRALNLANPTSLPWTWLMERFSGAADGITVASRFLQQRFGGVLIPHVRDTEAWKPGGVDPAGARRRLGIGPERVVMFLGTPRGYKGVDDLAAAVARLGRRDVVLALVGTDPASATGRALVARLPCVRLVGRVPFAQVPEFLSAADVVAVPQRDTPDTRGQVPAKIFDAMALARPVISTRVSMIPEILEGCGLLVAPGDVAALAQGIAHLLDRPDEARRLGQRARERCVERYSFSAARRDLFPLVERTLERR